MKTSTSIFFILVCIILIILGPFATIWSLNTLFNLGIAYSFKTWLSVFILAMIYNSKQIVKN